MAYGTLCYGLLTGAFTDSTTFLDWDWRSSGRAFGLPLFRREPFLKELRVVGRLKEIAARHGRSVAQLAIAWVLGHPAVTVALVGIRRSEELRENVAAVEWGLSAEERQEIDRAFAEEGVPSTSTPRRSWRQCCRPERQLNRTVRRPARASASVPGEHHLAGATGGKQVERLLRLG